MPRWSVHFSHPVGVRTGCIVYGTCIPAKACWASFTFLDSKANWRGSKHFSLATHKKGPYVNSARLVAKNASPRTPRPKCHCTHTPNYDQWKKMPVSAKMPCRNHSVPAAHLLQIAIDRTHTRTLKQLFWWTSHHMVSPLPGHEHALLFPKVLTVFSTPGVCNPREQCLYRFLCLRSDLSPT